MGIFPGRTGREYIVTGVSTDNSTGGLTADCLGKYIGGGGQAGTKTNISSVGLGGEIVE